MNRREPREQNDTIIRNLPKRLQRKIGAEVSDNLNRENGITVPSTPVRADDQHPSRSTQAGTAKECGKDLPSIDLFLRMKDRNVAPRRSYTAPVLETGGAGTKAKNTGTGTAAPMKERSNEKKTDVATIPGILRLNGYETLNLSNNAFDSAKRENSRRNVTRQQRNNLLRDELSVSPVGQIARTAAHPAWFQMLDAPYTQHLSQLHDTLVMMMQRNSVLENWQEFCDTHAQLENVFKDMLLHQLKFCCEQKVDTFFWKLLFYNVRDYLKSQKSSQAPAPAQAQAEAPAPARTLFLLENGIRFYTLLHTQLTEKYIQKPENGECHRSMHKFEFIAKVAGQKLLICLGDLSRYKAKEQEINDYSEAAKYYQQAQCLIPTNGIPYNKLAIIAIHARKNFDAIYFHMRSLMSSNAIYSARESMLVLFDEIRKKYEETELKASPIHAHSPNRKNSNSKSVRKEVWIYPDGVRRLHCSNIANNKTLVNEENRYSEMATDELFRRFISLYLYVIGKLYTGIGMESILEHQRKLFVQLSVLLKGDTLAITRSRILKMIALNIFIIEYNVQRDSRREIRYYALNFCNQMFGLFLRKSNQLIATYLEKADGKIFTNLNTVLQFVKIYIDWLQQNIDSWEPIRNEEHIFIDTWSELESHFNNLQRVLGERNVDLHSTVLEEDMFLMGFTPLSKSMPSPKHYEANFSSEMAQFQTRLRKIAAFKECYNANNGNLKIADDSNFCFEEINTAIHVLDDLQGKKADINETHIVNGLNRSHSATELQTEQSANATADSQMSQLSKLKKELEAKTNVKKMYTAKLEQILKFVDTKLYIEVRPKYLLPDTNCFIDWLEHFESMLKEFKYYTLVIPLTVVKELDGLSKGIKPEMYESSMQKHRIHHFDDVSTRAKKSLDFINSAKNNVKCATTKGSIINASLFALVEEEHVSNDDKILATALALSKTMSTETSKDGKCFIQTELVLITSDRNLRVKALSRNLAVSELSEFLQWAKEHET